MAKVNRRHVLQTGGAALAAGALAPGAAVSRAAPLRVDTWDDVRAQFELDPAWTHFGGLYIVSHPAPVRAAIEGYRAALDANPVLTLQDNSGRYDAAVRQAAASYLGVQPGSIALTDSTTMGHGLLYHGLDLRPGQEALTSTHDFFAQHEALEARAAQVGVPVRYVRLYDRPAQADEGEIVARLMGAVTDTTRVVGITWVHSSTGVKLPVRAIADALAEVNRGRAPEDRALLVVDGVHGMGAEDETLPSLGADVFTAGCHKWLLGPRGTGILWARPEISRFIQPTIPSFSGGSWGADMTPGGFKAFEHRWALGEAFAFHQAIGKARVAARVHELSTQLKEGLAAMRHVTLHTPMADALSAGLVCFEVAGLGPQTVVQRLRDRRIVATTTPYSPSYARLAPAIFNTPEEVDAALRVVNALG